MYPHSVCQPAYILFNNILLSKIWFSTKFLIKQGVTYMSLSYFIFNFFSPQPYDAMIDFINFLKMLNIQWVTPMDMDSPLSSMKEWIIRSHCVKSFRIRSVYYGYKCKVSLNIRAFLPDIRAHVFSILHDVDVKIVISILQNSLSWPDVS